ncbi:MAG: hypothetical protein A2749_01790 [Parcubacteria group bacterium RIFCSPHIGHO2_01_FULL_45_26]|nr:MAG: hypothetical protein A2749_01790 [Parcubacteria group bacterium RIFCSPHIGHO2_01_FULL_45_26]
MKIFTPEERVQYLAKRNRKLMSSTVIFLDEADKVLVLETTYEENWEVPGGGIEENESPLEAARRETKEELGFDIKDPKFVGVDYRHTQKGKEEMLHFVFFGGVLDKSKINQIKLQPEELKAYKFVDLEEVYKICGPNIGPRVGRALGAIRTSSSIYWDSK